MSYKDTEKKALALPCADLEAILDSVDFCFRKLWINSGSFFKFLHHGWYWNFVFLVFIFCKAKLIFWYTIMHQFVLYTYKEWNDYILFDISYSAKQLTVHFIRNYVIKFAADGAGLSANREIQLIIPKVWVNTFQWKQCSFNVWYIINPEFNPNIILLLIFIVN